MTFSRQFIEFHPVTSIDYSYTPCDVMDSRCLRTLPLAENAYKFIGLFQNHHPVGVLHYLVTFLYSSKAWPINVFAVHSTQNIVMQTAPYQIVSNDSWMRNSLDWKSIDSHNIA